MDSKACFRSQLQGNFKALMLSLSCDKADVATYLSRIKYQGNLEPNLTKKDVVLVDKQIENDAKFTAFVREHFNITF